MQQGTGVDEYEVIEVGAEAWLRHVACDKKVALDYLDGGPQRHQRQAFESNHVCGPAGSRWNSGS